MTKFDREPCTCLDDYKRRDRIDPQCKACNTDVNQAIDEVERLDRIANHQIHAIDALDRECHRIRSLLSRTLSDYGHFRRITRATLDDIRQEVGSD